MTASSRSYGPAVRGQTKTSWATPRSRLVSSVGTSASPVHERKPARAKRIVAQCTLLRASDAARRTAEAAKPFYHRRATRLPTAPRAIPKGAIVHSRGRLGRGNAKQARNARFQAISPARGHHQRRKDRLDRIVTTPRSGHDHGLGARFLVSNGSGVVTVRGGTRMAKRRASSTCRSCATARSCPGRCGRGRLSHPHAHPAFFCVTCSR